MPIASNTPDVPLRSEIESVRVAPEGSAWSRALRAGGGVRSEAIDEGARTFREALGLPVDRAIVMSGHQPTLWHAGIAAKWLAIGAAVNAWGATPAWVVVDHDAVAPLTLDVPTIDGDGVVRRVRVLPERGEERGRAACDRPAVSTRGVRVPNDVPVEIRDRVARALELIESQANAPDAGTQATRVMLEFLRRFSATPTIVRATSLLDAPVTRDIVERMSSEAGACVMAYNAAALKHRATRVRPLRIAGDEIELPLWSLERDSTRRPVYASQVRSLLADRDARLVPRALLLTYLLRRYACDLFVHGTGGGGDEGHEGYDAVMHDWIAGWLGGGAWLAPMGVATATVRLDLPANDDADRLAWVAHAARHNPVLADSAESAAAQETKFERVGLIARSTDRDERARLYREMHAGLAEFRSRHAGTLADLDARAIASRASGASIARSRTWSVLLHDTRALDELRDRVRLTLLQGTHLGSIG